MPRFKLGDLVATTHLRREVTGEFCGTIQNSEPSATSKDLLARVRIDGVFYLRRLSELRPAGVNDTPAEPEATCVVPIECVFGEGE